ncbi:ABC transporter substrate-binding protein [Paracoccus contaminans]|uniref:ABC transporter substrate-binding protein n=1 Tax=Paracoccus contaminans TaxID=1945662 RepID=A0A1W6D1G5_9RHOB|nr:extracellular solute-binding protein [Paracoccus contaminans]ARJ70957.1 ABC transporter substrate-binding protein [Paracoccus contaminans]
MTYEKGRGGLWTRRQTMRGAGALGLGLSLAGLAAPAVRAQSARPIRFLNCETGKDTLAFFGKMAKDYQDKTGTEVVVDSVPLDEAFTKITNGVRSGTPYDVANVGFIGQVLMLAEQDLIVPLNELTDAHQWGNNILFPIDGKVYWYPFDYNLALIYYRKDLYEAKGLAMPETWDAFAANCEALVEGRQRGCLFPIGSNGAANWMSFAFLWAEGVRLFDDQWNVILDSAEMAPRVAAYLDFMARLYPTMPSGALQASYADVLSNLVGGAIGHGAYAGRVFEAVERDNPGMAGNFGLMPYMDSAGKQKAVSHGYDGWVVLKTDNTGRTMDFMRWLTTERMVDFLHTAPVHFQPTRLDIYDDPRWRDNPLIKKHEAAIEQMRALITDNSVILSSIDTQGPAPDVRPGKVFESFVMPEMLQNKILRGMDSAEAVKAAAARMRDVIK